jgi:heme o synthase
MNHGATIVKNAYAVAAQSSPRAGLSFAPADYLELLKPRLNLLVVATSAAGYYLGAPGPPELVPMIQAVGGTALVAGGAAVLNQVFERDTDALMRRTRSRPIPDGRVTVLEAHLFGVALSCAGLVALAMLANMVAAALAFCTLFIYLAIYTPLKRRSPAATLVGAIPGALPALIGWAARSGGISPGGLSLAAIVFCWQVPHFMAIAWLYREDYGRAGLPTLPVVDPGGSRTAHLAIGYATALVPLSVLPTITGVSGVPSAAIALVLAVALLCCTVLFAIKRTEHTAWTLFFGSIVYLPLLWMAVIVGRN